MVVDNMSATMFRGLIRAYGKFKSVLSAKRDLEDRCATPSPSFRSLEPLLYFCVCVCVCV